MTAVPRIEIPDGKADPEVRMWKLRPEMGMGAGALSHAVYEQSIVPVRERELARMRIAQINDCAICQQWRKTAGAAEAMTEDDFANVADWRTYPGYSARERLAVEYAERFALDHLDLDDDVLRPPARRVHRRRDPRPHRVHRRVDRARPHDERARHRRCCRIRPWPEPDIPAPPLTCTGTPMRRETHTPCGRADASVASPAWRTATRPGCTSR